MATEQATLNLLTSMSASFTLQSIVQGITEFDGKNVPLKDFIQDIRNGRALIDDKQEANFIRLIIAKLKGPARDCIYGKTVNTTEGLVKILKERFAPCKDFSYYDSNIHNLRMKNGDTVGDFHDRINILLNCAQSALKEELGTDYSDVMMTPIKNSTLKTFIDGLPKEIGDLVDIKQPKSLEEAYKEALRIETRNKNKPKHEDLSMSKWLSINRGFNVGYIQDQQVEAEEPYYKEWEELPAEVQQFIIQRQNGRFYQNNQRQQYQNQNQENNGSHPGRLYNPDTDMFQNPTGRRYGAIAYDQQQRFNELRPNPPYQHFGGNPGNLNSDGARPGVTAAGPSQTSPAQNYRQQQAKTLITEVRQTPEAEKSGVPPAKVMTILKNSETLLPMWNNFPIEEDGTLGRDYLIDTSAVISYYNGTLMVNSDLMNPIPFLPTNVPMEHLQDNLIKTMRIVPKDDEISELETDSDLDYAIEQLANERISNSKPGRVKNVVNHGTVKYTIGPRSRQIIQINLIETELTEGYLPRIDVKDEKVFLGEGVVANANNTCKIMAINTHDDEEVTIEVDPREILPFEQFKSQFSSSGGEDVSESKVARQVNDQYKKRGENLLQLIRTGHLSPSELQSVKRLLKRMPEGLMNAPTTFQRMMNILLRELLNVEMLVYLDDVIVYAKNLHEHEVKVGKLFERLSDAGLVLQPDKVNFLCREVKFLGHIVSGRGVEPDPKLVEAVMKFPRPKGVRSVRSFLGLSGYYRRFIQDYSKIAKPLSDLTKKGQEYDWGPAQEEAFEKLKKLLCVAPILTFPDFNKPFKLTTDASDYAIGATEEDPEQLVEIRRRAHTASNEARPKGRPVGAKTNKGRPQLDHSTVAERTRSKKLVPTTSKSTGIHKKTWASVDKEKMRSKRVQEPKNCEAELPTDDSSTEAIEETLQRKQLADQNYESVANTSEIEVVVNKNAIEDEKRKSAHPKLHWRVQEILNRLDRESQSSIMSDSEADMSKLLPSSSRRSVVSSTGVEDRDAKKLMTVRTTGLP
ncbi:uncharacterized protein LOC131663872 [Phymastichus coffea]|uniref:uncharacterized protein LOC131663872 n=1 Tax=Phymastichus coffea TaxID=108790 RepID=UPI00273C0C66|nr:uncharacterized protein LOC131663872 [Phymastichus coffea]